jgi:translocation and assembly module TamB
MRGLIGTIALIGVLSIPMTATAQDADEGTRLERLLESQLSDGDGFTVDLQGFRGAISSTAELDRMVISDAQGPWLILDDATLIWTRSALLRGELSVQELTAARLQVLRRPAPGDEGIDLPPAEATPFSLPELPVSIDIGRVAIEQVDLGEPIIGVAAQLGLSGNVQLADGQGRATLDITRQDGPRGTFALDVGYANTTGQLDLSLLLEEDPGGLVAELIDLPGAPDLRLSVQGSGPLADLTTVIDLQTEGQQRLAGTVTAQTTGDTGDRVILVDLGGDISALLLPDYRAFFGDDIDLASRVTLFGDGRIALDDLALQAAAIDLTGRLALRADRQPESFALSGQIANPSGGPVQLPVPGDPVLVDAITLGVLFDAASSSGYRADFDLIGLNAADIAIDRATIDVTGAITEDDNAITAVTADLVAMTEGLAHTDPAVTRAIGPSQRIEAGLSWFEGAPLFLTDLAASAGDLSLSGTAALRTSDGQVAVTADLLADAADLSRFADLAGQPLAGALTGSLDGTAELLSGAFDMTLTATASGLQLADGLPPGLFAGDTDLTIAAVRDETGLTLNTLTLDGTQITLDGAGRVSSGNGTFTADMRLADLGLFTDVVRGPVTGTVALDQPNAGPWSVDADLTGPAGIRARLSGDVGLPDNAVDLSAAGSLPLSLANRALAPRSLNGTLNFDLTMIGQPGLPALSGQFQASGVRASLPTLQTALENMSIAGRLANGRVNADVSGRLASGGQLDVGANVTLTNASLPADITIAGRGLRLIDPTLYNALIEQVDLRFGGALLGAGQVTGTVALGETEIRVPETGLGASSIPDITHIGETAAERQTRVAAGLVDTSSGGGGGGGASNIGLDITVTAPGRVFVRGRGLDAELGGTLELLGTTANVLPAGRFDLIRGRLSILGTRLDLTDGSVTLQGGFDPFIRLLATSRAGGYTIGINVIGPVSNPAISFTSDPALPEDEVLAQLLFGRSVSSLSPVQLLQMADAAASLAGGSSNGGALSNLRENLGLDDLDLQTDSEGGAALRAGRYISENIYTDLTINSTGETDLSLNIDLTDSITARGSFSTDGSSSLGVFFERDY